MIYNSAKIRQLLNSIEDNLAEEQQNIVKEILSNYNRLYILAVEKTKELEGKRKLYLTESEEKGKLIEKIQKLEKENKRLKKQNEIQKEILKQK